MWTRAGTDVSDAPDTWRQRHATMAADWRALLSLDHERDAALIEVWKLGLHEARATQQALVDRGLWRGGPRTLLAAIDVHHRELAMTAGLAWLLRPDGHHGLGPAVLVRLLSHLGIAVSGARPDVRIVLEETRDQTRADLVMYGRDWTVVVEAKTFAMEQEDQLYRLHSHWCDEPGPVFVFLTRGVRIPLSADTTSSEWRGLTWREVAAIGRAAASSVPHPAPGVYEYINTLEAFHHV